MEATGATLHGPNLLARMPVTTWLCQSAERAGQTENDDTSSAYNALYVCAAPMHSNQLQDYTWSTGRWSCGLATAS